MTATAAAAPGQSITGVAFEISPADANTWTTIATATTGPYAVSFDTSTVTPGDYDIRATATDSAGVTASSAVARDVVIAEGATFVAEQAPSVLHGTVTLVATPENTGIIPNQVTFQVSSSSGASWTDIATVVAPLDEFGNPIPSGGRFVTKLDSTTLADGNADLRVIAQDAAGDTFVSQPLRNVLVDNTPPVSSVTVPAGTLGGIVTLTATATDSGTGVASVRFEVSPAGSGAWSTIGAVTSAPYVVSLDTRGLADGAYDLRVVATDAVGNQASSPVLTNVSVSNPGKTIFGNFVITSYVVPATNLTLLGEIANSPQHETWAYGYTTAPPATVGGAQLPYTAQSGDPELVLLRYTDSGGWQIADVLRNPDGTAFNLLPGVASAQVSGQMTPAGDAWILLRQAPQGAAIGQVSIFHKSVGRTQFLLDPSASATLASLVSVQQGSVAPSLQLGESGDGSTYGLVIDPEQAWQQRSVTSSGGSNVTISTQLSYAVLQNGAWSIQTATLPTGFAPLRGELVTLLAADATGPGSGWATLQSDKSHPLMLAHFDSSGWTFVTAGFDALDLTGAFSKTPGWVIAPTAVHADSSGLWLSAFYQNGVGDTHLVVRYDFGAGRVVNAWCGLAISALGPGCALPLDANHPATVPDAVFQTADGLVAESLAGGFVDIYRYGAWTSVAAPGFNSSRGQSPFVSLSDGWLIGPYAVGRMSPQAPPAPLSVWPEPNRSTLLSVALPPAGAGIGTSGALAVGLSGTALHYDAAAGWVVDPTPTRAQHVNLRGVAFDGPGSAMAVGDFGTILDWNGSVWSSDPQSTSLTQAQLYAVAFGADGQGWAVGAFGTILHWDGTVWTQEQIDAADSGVQVTSVAVAGQDVFAIAGGNLIERGAGGQWQRVDLSSLPSPAPVGGTLRLVSGLPDGGAAVAGQDVLMVRQDASSPFRYSDQPISGIAVALSAFRNPSTGEISAFVSVAPPVGGSTDVGGFPAGDGDLVVDGGGSLVDLSRAQYPGKAVGPEGAVIPDPVLAVAAAPDGSAAWAVGGYVGTVTADGLGTTVPLQARPAGWQTASVWRYDTGASRQSPTDTTSPVTIPATPGTVSFAFFSSPECKFQCASVRDAQPDVNLAAAAAEIASFAHQPGGPAFAILGGNAVGPIDSTSYAAGGGAVDLANLSNYLAPLGSVPLFAAYGPRDGVPTSTNPAQPWADAFAQSPAPFGRGSLPSGITASGGGGATGAVNLYYAFDAAQNGGIVRVIVLDNSAGSLEASVPGQTAWLDAQLAAAQAAGLSVVVIAGRPLDPGTSGAASDGLAVATKLAKAGVLAVFTASTTNHVATISAGGSQLTEYQGATLGYQQDQNNGVLWYFASVDTVAKKVSVQAIPVVQSLALEPLAGLSVDRSSTLSFAAVGRRLPGTIATLPNQLGGAFPGFDNYVSIPSANCGGCVVPSYAFASSDPTIGDFVLPSAPGSLLPLLDAAGKPIPSSQSGLFCAYNAGTTTVSVTSGLLTASLPVTVQPGGIGRPCGTVFHSGAQHVVNVGQQHLVSTQLSPNGLGVSPGVTPTPVTIQPKLAAIVPPPPPAIKVNLPAPKPAPVPAPTPPPVIAPPPSGLPFVPSGVQTPAVAVPPIPPPVTTVPPGGATASAQATARREEKARRHAQSSAYTIRPAGVSAIDWFYPAVGVTGLLVVILAAEGLSGPRQRRAFVEARDQSDLRRGRSRRYR